MTTLERACGTRIIKADDIYECLACSKMYTQAEMHTHELVCAKIPAYLEWLKTQDTTPDS